MARFSFPYAFAMSSLSRPRHFSSSKRLIIVPGKGRFANCTRTFSSHINHRADQPPGTVVPLPLNNAPRTPSSHGRPTTASPPTKPPPLGAFELLRQQKASGVAPAEKLYEQAIHELSQAHELEKALGVFRELVALGHQPQVPVFTSLIAGCGKAKLSQDARKLFREMTEDHGMLADETCYTALLDALGRDHRVTQAEVVWAVMQLRFASLGPISWTAMICVYLRGNFLHKALALLHEMKKAGVAPNSITYTALLNSLCDNGQLEDALRMFKEMAEHKLKPDIVAINSFIRLLAKARKIGQATTVFKSLQSLGVEPNEGTYRVMFYMWHAIRKPKPAEAMLAAMKAIGTQPNVVLYTSLIALYMKKRSTHPRALEIYEQMRKEGVQPNAVTHASMLSYCDSDETELIQLCATHLHEHFTKLKTILSDREALARAPTLANAGFFKRVKHSYTIKDIEEKLAELVAGRLLPQPGLPPFCSSLLAYLREVELVDTSAVFDNPKSHTHRSLAAPSL